MNTRGRRLLSLPLPGQDSNSSSSDGDQFDDGVTSDLEMETSAPRITFRGVTPHCINGVGGKKTIWLSLHTGVTWDATLLLTFVYFFLEKKQQNKTYPVLFCCCFNPSAGFKPDGWIAEFQMFYCKHLCVPTINLTVKPLPSFSGLAV